MSPTRPNPTANAASRRGFTLAELLMAMVVTVMIMGAMASLATAVSDSVDYSQGRITVVQHARVVFNRIAHHVEGAAADTPVSGSNDYHGIAVLADTVDSWTFPDTLVIWSDDTNNDAVPQVNELIVICPNPSDPSQLVEITDSVNAADAASFSNTVSLGTQIDALKASNTAETVVLTDRLHYVQFRDNASAATTRAAVRFVHTLAPDATDWADYQAGTLTWNNLPWVRDIYSADTGLRQSWVRMEIQLRPDSAYADSEEGVPFFGSAALYYQVDQN